MYNNLLDQESGELKVDARKPVVFEGETLSRNSLRAINTSDIIRTFSNQRKFILMIINLLNLNFILFSRKARKHEHSHRHERDRYYYFDVSSVSQDDEFMDAEMRIYRDMRFNIYPANWTYHFQLYQIVITDEE